MPTVWSLTSESTGNRIRLVEIDRATPATRRFTYSIPPLNNFGPHFGEDRGYVSLRPPAVLLQHFGKGLEGMLRFRFASTYSRIC